MDISRKHDIAELKADLRKTTDKTIRQSILKTGRKIEKEQNNNYLRSARERMIKEKLAGSQDNVRDIQDNLIKQRKNGSLSFGLNIPDKVWSDVFKS